jgi:hypothetical protein
MKTNLSDSDIKELYEAHCKLIDNYNCKTSNSFIAISPKMKMRPDHFKRLVLNSPSSAILELPKNKLMFNSETIPGTVCITIFTVSLYIWFNLFSLLLNLFL